LSNPETAWNELRSGKSITAQESEAFLDAIFQEGVLNVDFLSLEKNRALTNLTHALQQNHHDSWFKDFLDAPFSVKANHFLRSAMANRNSDAKRALKDARVAEDLYLQVSNIAGAARSQTEIIYAYRRLSRSSECLQEIGRLKERIKQRSYTSFQFLGNYESTNCQTMLGNFDLGRQFAEHAYAEADGANYFSLKLRALGLFSAMASAEGRYQAAFNLDAAELAIYWDGYYEGKRGFQFYSDAALIAEQAGYWQLAAMLQREAVDSLGGTELIDFQATAHYHLATSLQRAGNPSQAQQEFREAYNLFGKMHDPSFLLASSEVELAQIEIEQGNLISAQAHLEKAASEIAGVGNFLVKLSYYNTLANLERRRNQPAQEWKYLQKTIEIAKQGFLNLSSVDNRWEWYREVDRSVHRLIELELDAKHDPLQALADWEAYRAAEIAPAHLGAGDRLNRARLASHLKGMRSSTLVSFIVFPERVVIGVADNRNVRVFSTAVDSETLSHEAETFLRLCSDKNSSLEKVNQAGSRLYERLLQPIQKELLADRSLVIEADGVLSRIPWPALVAGNGKYLEEQYMTASTPGLFFSDTGHGRRTAIAGRLVVYPGAAEYEGKLYPPLPHAREEADYVAQLRPDSTYLREEQVTRNELLKKLPRASSFHFAGHGVSREHGGELLLSGKEALSASAVRRLDLSGMDLVVLSACSTAEADLDIARSPNGLVQAFLSAGARKVVATRWDVDSQASLKFSMNFYATSAGSADVATVARAARQAIRSDPKMQHPYYWGAFELYGNAN
jgi:CHAT domain-containing protein